MTLKLQSFLLTDLMNGDPNSVEYRIFFIIDFRASVTDLEMLTQIRCRIESIQLSGWQQYD